MEQRKGPEVVIEIANFDILESGPVEEIDQRGRRPDSHMRGVLSQNAGRLQSFDEIGGVRGVKVKRTAGSERRMNRPQDA